VLGSALPRATADTLLLSSCSCQLTPSVAAPAGASSPLLLLLLLLQVPADQVATTPVQLYATAGLRALPNDTSARLLAAVAGTLASSGFRWGQGWGEGGGVLWRQRQGMHYRGAAGGRSSVQLSATQALAQCQLAGACMLVTCWCNSVTSPPPPPAGSSLGGRASRQGGRRGCGAGWG
jgi:hypothetical protein